VWTLVDISDRRFPVLQLVEYPLDAICRTASWEWRARSRAVQPGDSGARWLVFSAQLFLRALRPDGRSVAGVRQTRTSPAFGQLNSRLAMKRRRIPFPEIPADLMVVLRRLRDGRRQQTGTSGNKYRPLGDQSGSGQGGAGECRYPLRDRPGGLPAIYIPRNNFFSLSSSVIVSSTARGLVSVRVSARQAKGAVDETRALFLLSSPGKALVLLPFIGMWRSTGRLSVQTLHAGEKSEVCLSEGH